MPIYLQCLLPSPGPGLCDNTATATGWFYYKSLGGRMHRKGNTHFLIVRNNAAHTINVKNRKSPSPRAIKRIILSFRTSLFFNYK